MQKQKVRFSHPLYQTVYEAELPVTMTFKEISVFLIEQGFLTKKAGGYQFIFDDHLCGLSAPLSTYIPDPAPEWLEIRVHGLLIILT